ncbi:MAG TPA: ABC transporter ATP-binding protein [Mobilitalea sp.]|nr:ABC transporter ATP-binding protein [Mobilitalea sp.]
MAYIRFEHINKYFGENHVLKDINLDIEREQLVTLLGPSGCGKSTLLRCLSGLERITSGRIFMDGTDITDIDPRDRNIGMVFQQYSLFPNMNVAENIAFGLRMKKLGKNDIAKKVSEVIGMVELSGKEKAYPANLSGGQQQRVALARAIVTRPKVLLLDEPLSAIDAKLRRSLQQSIKRIQSELGITSIFVTHDQDEAMVMSDRIHLFHNGEIEQSDSPISIYTNPRTKFAAEFIGHYNIITAAQFHKITGGTDTVSENVAIRPEAMEISLTPHEKKENSYQFQGIIINHLSHGNVLRYNVEVSGISLEVDVLFRSFYLYENGQTIFISVEHRNCLPV